MKFLHVSDIHFNAPDCLNPDRDPDAPFRAHLLRDAAQHASTYGAVHAIVVTGDIAYKGQREEFQVADAWLRQLAEYTGCSEEKVFVVPGNHDVDRNVISNSQMVRNAQQAIVAANEMDREKTLKSQLKDAHTGPALFLPLRDYNDFAKRFNCQVSSDALSWAQSFSLTDTVRIRLYGLTPTILSGKGGHDDTRGALYLSPLQTAFSPDINVVNMALCHHPPDWLVDGDDVDNRLNGGTVPLQLFGHKHLQRITREEHYVRFSAGAVNPSRQESNWQPGYNIFDVTVDGEGTNRKLRIEAHLRNWQTNPDQFVARMDKEKPIFVKVMDFPEPTFVAQLMKKAGKMVGSSTERVEDAMSEARGFLDCFWGLQSSQRYKIAMDLGLVEEAERMLPEPQLYRRVLVRAAEKGLLEQLKDRVAKEERTK